MNTCQLRLRVCVCIIALLAIPSLGLAVPILYATDAADQIDTLNSATGVSSLVGSFGVGGYMAGLAYDPARDTLYGTTTGTDKLYSINRSTGAATLIGGLGATLMHGLAFDTSSQTLYGTFGATGNDGLYSIDTATGASALIGHVGFFHSDTWNTIHGLAVSPQTGALYGAISGPAYDWGALVQIDKTTGHGQLIGTFTSHISGLVFNPETGALYGVDNWSGYLYTIDPATATTTYIGRTGIGNALGLEFTPEPATLSLLAFGSLLVMRRKRRSRMG